MKKSIVNNLTYNLLLQMILMVIPLITLPYVSRVLGSEGVGVYSYTSSISQYFIIIGSIGLTMYGSRQIAYSNDINIISKNFWSIMLLRTISIILVTTIYMSIFWRSQDYNVAFMIQTISIVSVIIDISWLYIGLEDFKKTVFRNALVKILGMLLIFLLVKTKEDINLYIMINVLMILFGNLSLWVYLPKTVKLVRISIKDITSHLTPAFQLFIPQVAVQVYIVLDKSMIGWLSTIEQVGLFSQSEIIVKSTLAFVTALGTVMMPRMSNIYVSGDNALMKHYLNISLKAVAYIAIPMSFGVASISNEFVPWFFGPGYEPVVTLIQMMCPIIYFIGMSNVMGMQFLVPANKTKIFTLSVIIGAIVNVVTNLLLIPRYHALGACVATIMAEMSVALTQYYFLKKEINLKAYYKSASKYVFAALVMFFVVRIVGIAMGARLVTTIIQGITGIIVYFIVIKVQRDEINDLVASKVGNLLYKILGLFINRNK